MSRRPKLKLRQDLMAASMGASFDITADSFSKEGVHIDKHGVAVRDSPSGGAFKVRCRAAAAPARARATDTGPRARARRS